MNNPLRPLAQRLFEARQLLKMGGQSPNARVLEIGSGSGGGIELLFNSFKAARVDAFDLDSRMVRLAAKRHRSPSEKIMIWQGNVRHIPVKDKTYEAVFDFGTLHHVVDWQTAIEEVYRVLKPGGRFYIEEITRQFIVHPLGRWLTDHPQQNRFDHDDLVEALEYSGYTVRCSRQYAGLFIWCIADR